MKNAALISNSNEFDNKSEDARKAEFVGQGQFCKLWAAQAPTLLPRVHT
jgi:hypothetical protein